MDRMKTGYEQQLEDLIGMAESGYRFTGKPGLDGAIRAACHAALKAERERIETEISKKTEIDIHPRCDSNISGKCVLTYDKSSCMLCSTIRNCPHKTDGKLVSIRFR